MTVAGFPVPPGFTIGTSACREYFERGQQTPEGLWTQTRAAIAEMESTTGRRFGDDVNPLLCSVRSGAPVSMLGMMDTILNLGLNDRTTAALASLTGNPEFAWDSYRRFVQMFGEIVFGVPRERLQSIVESSARASSDKRSPDDSRALIARLKSVVVGHARTSIPDAPDEQLRLAVAAVFESWANRRAVDYRRLNNIADDMFTAVNVQAMVFGNTGPTSGTGVAFTRNPTTGEPTTFGEYLIDAQGEDVVAGIETPKPIESLRDDMPAVYEQLTDIAARLELHYRDMQDIEFTVEQGTLWMLQTRTGKRTSRAAIRIAVDLVAEAVIDRDEAIERVTPDRLEEMLHPVVNARPDDEVLAVGLPASPGGAAGMLVRRR